MRNDPRDVFAILALSRATYGKMIQNLLWATGYNTFAIPLAAGVAYSWSLLLTPALGAALMSLSTVIVAINAKLVERARRLVASTGEDEHVDDDRCRAVSMNSVAVPAYAWACDVACSEPVSGNPAVASFWKWSSSSTG